MQKKTHEIRLSEYRAEYPGGVLYLGTKESYGNEQIHVSLDEAWKDRVITAIFTNYGSTEVPMNSGGMIPVPLEATARDTASAGPGRIVFKGTADGTQLLTADLYYFVENHAAASGGNSLSPTPDLFTQFVESVKTDADRAEAAAEHVLSAGATPEQLAAAVDAYMAENPVQPVAVDESLTHSGQAADAKAVGEAIAQIELTPGPAGISPTVSVSPISGGHRITITDANGTKTMDVMDGTEAVPDYVTEEVDRLAAVVQSHQNENTVSFMACTDIHFSHLNPATSGLMKESLTNLGQAMRLIRDRVHIDFAVCLGDQIFDSGSETTEQLNMDHRTVHAHLSPAFLGLKPMFLEGNHDMGSNNATPLTPSQVYFHTSAYNDDATGYYTGEKALGACYFDFPRYKLRVILLNLNYPSDGQVHWLANALDVSGKTDGPWGTLVLAHQPADDVSVQSGILQAMREANSVVAQIHGHTHNSIVRTLGDTGIKGVSVMSASPYRRNECAAYADAYIFGEYNENGSAVAYPTAAETAGTARNTSFSILTLDCAEGKMYIDCYGCGYDRVVEIPNWTVAKRYTNRLPSALSFDGNGVFNDTGYKDGSYISTSAPYYGSDVETVCTGFIPYKNYGENGARMKPPTIYVKGVTLDASKSHHRIGFGYADFEGGVFTTKNMSTWGGIFEVTTLGDQYYKIEPLLTEDGVNYIWETWQVKSDYLAISAGGTGEDLIITLDEPIE